jgi:peptide/nickel transport system substrate-binding protein
VVVIGYDQVPSVLNPMLLSGNTVVTHQSLCPVICENMLSVDARFRYVPVLATEVPSEASGTLTRNPFTVTFTIRPKAAWSDRVPVTSADAIFTWQTLMDPRNGIASRSGWDKIRTIEALGPKRFRVVFSTPFAAWRDLFSPSGGYNLLPKHILDGQDFDTVWNRGGAIGTGPFVIRSYRPTERLVLTPNPNYWNRAGAGGGPFIARIVNVYLGDSNTQRVQFESGEVNFVNPPDFTLIPDYQSQPNTRVESPPGVYWEHLEFNTADPVMRDLNVRKAIAYAIDRQQLVDVSTKGQTRLLHSFLVPEQKPFYKPSWEAYGPDPAKVDMHMQAAGYRKNADGFYAKNGRELTIDFWTISGNRTRKDNVALIQAQLEAVGIRMRPHLVANFFNADGPLYKGRFQIAELAFQASVDPSSTQLFRGSDIPTADNSYSGQNTFRYADPRLDALLEASDEAIEVPQRARLMQRIQDELAAKMVMLPLYQRPAFIAYPDNLNGVVANPTQVSFSDVTHNWWFAGGRAAR